MSTAAQDVAANAAASANNRVPPEVREKIEDLLRSVYPNFEVILKIPELYKQRYGQEMNPATCFGGHKSIFEMIRRSMQDTVEVYHHEGMRLWVAKIRDPSAPGEAMVVDEDGEGVANNRAGGGEHNVEIFEGNAEVSMM